MSVLHRLREFAGEEIAQHVGDGLAMLEGCNLDPGSQFRRHIDGQPRREEVAGALRRRRRLARADPGFGVARARCESAVRWARGPIERRALRIGVNDDHALTLSRPGAGRV